MTHLDLEDQLDVALGSPVDAIISDHLRTCDVCRTEQATLQRAAEGVRGSAAETLEVPPARIWAAIANEVDGDITSPDIPSSAPNEQTTPERHSQSPRMCGPFARRLAGGSAAPWWPLRAWSVSR